MNKFFHMYLPEYNLRIDFGVFGLWGFRLIGWVFVLPMSTKIKETFFYCGPAGCGLIANVFKR